MYFKEGDRALYVNDSGNEHIVRVVEVRDEWNVKVRANTGSVYVVSMHNLVSIPVSEER